MQPTHDEVGGTGLPPEVLQGDDGRVVQGRQPLGPLVEGAHDVGAIGDRLLDDPDHEVPVDPGEAGGVDRSVVAGAEALTQAVAPQRKSGGLGQQERRVMSEDLPLDLLEAGRGVEAEVLDQDLPVVPEHGEGFGLAAAAVEGDHQLGAEGLPHLMGPGQGLDLGDQFGGPSAGQLGVEEALVGHEAQLAQALGLRPGPVLVGELLVGLPPPQGQALP